MYEMSVGKLVGCRGLQMDISRLGVQKLYRLSRVSASERERVVTRQLHYDERCLLPCLLVTVSAEQIWSCHLLYTAYLYHKVYLTRMNDIDERQVT